MKKLWLVLAVIGCLGLATVAQTELPADVQAWVNNIRAKYAGVTIRVSATPHPSIEAFKAMTPEFTALTGIKVEYDEVGPVELRQQHFVAHTAGTGVFDVLMTDGFWIEEYALKGVIEPLRPYLEDPELTPAWFDWEDILPAYRETISSVYGEPYGVVTAGESRFIAYRKDLFEKYGICPPKTTEDLLEVAKFFNGREPGLYGFATRAARGIYFSSGWLHILYQFSDGWIDQKTGKVIADTPPVIESLEYWVELLRQGPPDIAVYTHEEASSAFMAGKVALWFEATAIAGWLIDPAKSKVYDKVGFLPPPYGPNGWYGGLAGWNFAISSDSRNKGAAWAYIVWMTSRFNAKKYLAHGGVENRLSVLQDPEITSRHPELYEALLKTFEAAANLAKKGMKWIPPTWLSFGVLDVMGDYGNMALTGELTPEEACKRGAAELRALFGQ